MYHPKRRSKRSSSIGIGVHFPPESVFKFALSTNLTRPKLLIIDEVGYLKLEPAEASLLFQVISERYDRSGSIILTSNKAFSGWGEVFAGDAIMASAALDRLLHRCTVVNIRGESFTDEGKTESRRVGPESADAGRSLQRGLSNNQWLQTPS